MNGLIFVASMAATRSLYSLNKSVAIRFVHSPFETMASKNLSVCTENGCPNKDLDESIHGTARSFIVQEMLSQFLPQILHCGQVPISQIDKMLLCPCEFLPPRK